MDWIFVSDIRVELVYLIEESGSRTSPSIYQPPQSSAKRCCAMVVDASANQAFVVYVSSQLSLVMIVPSVNIVSFARSYILYSAACLLFG